MLAYAGDMVNGLTHVALAFDYVDATEANDLRAPVRKIEQEFAITFVEASNSQKDAKRKPVSLPLELAHSQGITRFIHFRYC